MPSLHRALLLLVVVNAACASGPGVPEREALAPFGSCAELERHIKDQATRRMNAWLDRSMGLDSADTARSAALPAAAPSAGTYSTTNTQERGVDEPDIVKNDGSRLFVLQADRLVILRAWPPEALHVESVTPLQDLPSEDYYPTDMLLDGRTLVVFATRTSYVYARPDASAALFAPWPGAVEPAVRMTVFDVGGTVPLRLYDLALKEGYVSARRTGHLVRLVSTATLDGPDLRYYPTGPLDWRNRAAVAAAFEALRAANVEKIRRSTLADWLPKVTEAHAGAPQTALARECSAIQASGSPTSLGITTISTVDLARLADGPSQSAILSQADVVYASSASLYVAAQRYPASTAGGDEVRTLIHKFKASERRVDYEATGSVPGYIADQFSLDEEGAFLRVATTRQPTGTMPSAATSGVYVLRSSQGTLSIAGEVTGLAAGETLYAARFLGPRGYLVTFRRVDPLFTLDLLRPSDPRVAGELKVPGFSTYLHALDERHLLTIGREVAGDGRTPGGVLLEVFDVGDLQNPALRHARVTGTRYSNSEAGDDHKAFNFFASRSLLAIPFSDWTPSAGSRGYRSTIEVFRVTPQDGIEPVGSVAHDGLEGRTDLPGWTPQIRRSVMMEDFVYSISYSGVKVNDTRAAMRPVAQVTLAQP